MTEGQQVFDTQEYARLQRSWSVGRSAGLQKSVKLRVRDTCDWVRSCGWRIGDVLVIGPQHGFELLAFKDNEATDVLGIDVVPDFVNDCHDLGCKCVLSPAERMSEVPELQQKQWNIYSSHSFEHLADPIVALDAMWHVCHQWLCLIVPIETEQTTDKAHLSPVESLDAIRETLYANGKWKLIDQRVLGKKPKIDYRVLVRPINRKG